MKECTLMFYFASDNPLAISIVSQLKAIKAAGFHQQANVIVQFDPFTEGTPTHVFDVNLVNKLKTEYACKTDFTEDSPFVLNLIEDKLWNGERTRDGHSIRNETRKFVRGYDPPEPPNGLEMVKGEEQEIGPKKSLSKFLKFCRDNYPAKHYLLFILGHGVVVGNDVFLYDENADEHSLKLSEFGDILRKFKEHVKKHGGSFDLLGMHSCSVSSLEVAYELQDTARYLLASQGTAFVGSWPYCQMLRRVFNSLEHRTSFNQQTMKDMLVDLFFYCMHNSTDFLLAGYPFDLCLCDLSQISTIKEPLEKLSRALVNGLKYRKVMDLIVLAHWRSQSFFQEMYTDVYDFCFCLQEKIQELPGPLTESLRDLLEACEYVMSALEKERPRRKSNDEEKLIVCSEFAGPEYQYSHGLSLYFPWSMPPADRHIMREYGGYKISGKEFETSWLNFLNAYLTATRREPSRVEQHRPALQGAQALYEDKISLVYTREGPHNSQNALDQRAKTDPKDPTGGDCSCPSIKNFPNDVRGPDQLKQAPDSVTISEAFLPRSAG
jgi:Clostripain family